MAVIPQLVARSDNSMNTPMTPTMMNLLIALVILFAASLLCVGILLILRSRRKIKQSSEIVNDQPQRPNSKISHRRLAANTSQINIYSSEKEMMLEREPDSPRSPVPEIRITFPEEDDNGNKRTSGRVVVVSISERGGVGLEPYNDDHLPSYQRSEDRLESLDLERMGGLKEKERVTKL